MVIDLKKTFSNGTFRQFVNLRIFDGLISDALESTFLKFDRKIVRLT